MLTSILLATALITAAPWTADDVILGDSASEMRISPDGRWVLWIKQSPDKESDSMVGHLMLSSLTAEHEIQLTRGSDSASRPTWSPDSKLIAFITSRALPKGKARKKSDHKDDEAHDQIWLMSPFGGEPWHVTDGGRSVSDLGWIDADTLLFAAKEKKSLRESDLKEKKDDSEVFNDDANEPPVRLWKLSLKSKKLERFSDNKDRIHTLHVSPDGRYAVTVHEQELDWVFDHKTPPVARLFDLDTGDSQAILTKLRVSAIHWQSDSKGFYAVHQFTNHPRFVNAYVEKLVHVSMPNGKVTPIDLGWERGLADAPEGLAPLPDGFLTLLANGVRHQAARYTRTKTGFEKELLDAKNVTALRASLDGKVVVIQDSSSQSPPRWLRTDKTLQKLTVLTDLQADLRDKTLAKTEAIRWKGANGAEIEGLLMHPHDPPKAGEKRPLIVMIHGGPFWADFEFWEDRWAYVPNLLCQRGAYVLRPNYHGSSHYGLAFAESIADGKYYDLPVVDIEKGIDHVVGLGNIDPKKIGLGGWSNGAILTMALITRRHYQAAVAGAGGSEWVADWGVCNFGMSFSNYYLGKAPYEDPQLYRKNAPYFDFPKVRTPVLLFHGSDDLEVPSLHGPFQYRSLKQIGKTDVRFVRFPGEGHGLKKLAHQRRKIEEELAWFDRYLFQTLKPANPSFKSDSPLGHQLELAKASRHQGRFGVAKDNYLLPETVERAGLTVGRFEVTRAQFASFDPSIKMEPGRDNLPMTGVSADKAKAYCDWLGKVLGKKARLPSREEYEKLNDGNEVEENTLDAWAGYDVNPEDRERLQEKIRELPGPAPLLKAVGAHRSHHGLFDLGGNAAEWTSDNGPWGRSADRGSEDNLRGRPDAAYIGFRVVIQ